MDNGTATGSSGMDRTAIPEMIVRVVRTLDQAQQVLNEYMDEKLPDEAIKAEAPNKAFFFSPRQGTVLMIAQLVFSLESSEDLDAAMPTLLDLLSASLVAGLACDMRADITPDALALHVSRELMRQLNALQELESIGSVH